MHSRLTSVNKLSEGLMQVFTPDMLPTVVFDQIVAQLRQNNLSTDEIARLRLRAFSSILQIAEIAAPDDEIELKMLTLLDEKGQNITNRKLVSVCFLRLIAEPKTDSWFSDRSWRPKVVSFIETQLSDDYFRDQKIDPGLMTHEKIEKLSTTFQEIEKNFAAALNLLTSLDRLQAHRQRLMNFLNGKTGKLLFHPFLPDTFEAMLLEVYSKCEAYTRTRDTIEVLEAHTKIKETVEKLYQALHAHKTIYSLALEEKVARRIVQLAQDDISTNKIIQPGYMEVRPWDKKLPLHLSNQNVEFSFALTNRGPGYAFNVRIVVIAVDGITVLTEELELGEFAPLAEQLVEVAATVLMPFDSVELLAQVSWSNFEGISRSEDYSFIFDAQRKDIPWEDLKQLDPYSLEPVVTEQDLIGRKETLDRIIGTVKGSAVGSLIISGQKRVGKTSIAKALQSNLEKDNYIVVYLEGGDYVEPTAKATISRFGRKVCRELINKDHRTNRVPVPSFDESLSPLVDFLDEVLQVTGEQRIIFILDEFDELPLELYNRGPLGNAFFLTLRSLSSKQRAE